MKKLQSAFLAAMSHELRTPLNTIIGYSEMMEESAKEEGLKLYVENLGKVLYSSKQLLKLINDMFDLSRIEAGEMDIFLEDIKIEGFLKELDRAFRPSLEKNKNTFMMEIKTDKKTMMVDVMRMRQILLYLLDNANKFTHNGEITLVVDSNAGIQFSVKDTGIGIPPEQMDKLFQRFSQGDASVTRQYGGTGLGLYLAKNFCELLGGTINVKSQKGNGTTFVIHLPQNKIPDEERVKNIEKFQGKNALVISYDSSTVGEVLQDIEGMGFVVSQAKNGAEGLKLARSSPPDLIVLDAAVSFILGDTLMDQWLTLSELKSDPELSKIPLVVTTKEVSQEGLGFALGQVDFLTKPIDARSMMSKIKQLVPEETGTILVVDDDESARDIMSAAAKKAGWKSVSAVNGRDALDKIAKTLPSIILLDLMMPEMDGFTMIKELQKDEKWREIPIVIISAKELSRDERTMLAKYSKGIFQKGAYSRQELIDAICDQVK